MNNLTVGIEVSEHSIYFLIGMWNAVTAMWLNYLRRTDSASGYR